MGDFCSRALEEVRRLWHTYIVNQKPEAFQKFIEKMPENLLMLGTGRHEYYKNLEEFLKGITADQIEARDIRFEMQDEWYEAQEITDDVCVVYGSIWVREKAAPGKAVLVDMEGSRFTVVCRDTPEGVQICSIHHSMPYLDQGEDEYYPKSLASLANEAIKKSRVLEHRIEIDHMTELYNRVYMEYHVSRALKLEAGCFFSLDLDNFKCVNDSKGHLVGDEVIIEFSKLLRKTFSTSAIIGRMGGDEFAVWESRVHTAEAADKLFDALAKGCVKLSEKMRVPVSCSAGFAFSCRTGEDFAALYQRADKAMYCAKGEGKGRCRLS